MKSYYLLPKWCRTAGKILLLLVLALVLDLVSDGKPGGMWMAHILSPKYLNMIAMPMLLAGLILLSFSPVRHEDEYTGRLRTSSFMISALANSLFIFAAWSIYYIWAFSDADKSMPWQNVYIFCLQMYVIMILAIYLTIFHIRLRRATKSMENEE